MKKLTENQTRSSSMKRSIQSKTPPIATHRAPLFASPWVALFAVLRHELTRTRPETD
jgi:hypothetical protein